MSIEIGLWVYNSQKIGRLCPQIAPECETLGPCGACYDFKDALWFEDSIHPAA